MTIRILEDELNKEKNLEIKNELKDQLLDIEDETVEDIEDYEEIDELFKNSNFTPKQKCV